MVHFGVITLTLLVVRVGGGGRGWGERARERELVREDLKHKLRLKFSSAQIEV